MKFIKQRLSLKQRFHFIKKAFSWLKTYYIPEYDPETKKWLIVRMSLNERFACFWAELETAIYGYLYKVEFDKNE